MSSAATKLQDRIIEATEKSLVSGRDVAIDAPTGSGKSRQFCKIAENGARRNERTLILSHRQNLARQALVNMKKWSSGDISTSLGIDGDFDQSGQVVSTTIQTANLHLDKIQAYDRVVVDEGHHALEGNQDYTRLIEALSKANPKMRLIAASATFPDQMEGMHKRIARADKHTITFEEAIEAKLVDLPNTVTPSERLKNGQTVADMVASMRGSQKGADLEGIGGAIRKQLPGNWVETQAWHYSKHFSEKQTLSFFDSVKEAEAFAKEVREYGIDVEAIHSGRGEKDNERALELYHKGELKGLVSVDMISEGFDVDARGLFLGKVTTSLREFRQIIGRGARSFGAEKGEKTLLLDMGASTFMHGEISAQASINNIAKNIESTSRLTMDLSPESEEARAIWRPIEGTKAYAAPIEDAIVYVMPSGKGYIAMQSSHGRKGPELKLLEIEGERKGRPTRSAFVNWSENAIRRSEKALARIMSSDGGIDAVIASDWQRNGNSVRRNIEMMTMSPVQAQQGLGR